MGGIFWDVVIVRALSILFLLVWNLIAAEPPAELRVATFNIRYDAKGDQGAKDWMQRKAVVVKAIREMNPDILGVQEALANQLQDLDRALPNYARVGVGRGDGRSAGEFCAIYYHKERVVRDASEGGTFWLSSSPESPGSKDWGNEIERICTWGRFVDRRTDRGFYLFNTHWDHRHQGSREKAGRLIAQRIDRRAHGAEEVILLGDFNATEENPALAHLLGKRVGLEDATDVPLWSYPLRSAFLELLPAQTDRRTFHAWSGNSEGPHMIDHLLISKGWKVSEVGISHLHEGEIWPSDHFPVWGVFLWPELGDS